MSAARALTEAERRDGQARLEALTGQRTAAALRVRLSWTPTERRFHGERVAELDDRIAALRLYLNRTAYTLR